jgi:hypothetical protein
MVGALAVAQDPRLPPVPPTPDIWDIHYSELEPLLERHLANNPDSLVTMDELARIDSALGKYDRSAELYRHALERERLARDVIARKLVGTLENLTWRSVRSTASQASRCGDAARARHRDPGEIARRRSRRRCQRI